MEARKHAVCGDACREGDVPASQASCGVAGAAPLGEQATQIDLQQIHGSTKRGDGVGFCVPGVPAAPSLPPGGWTASLGVATRRGHRIGSQTYSPATPLCPLRKTRRQRQWPLPILQPSLWLDARRSMC